jgi:glutamate/tyrosine decarboxylase-like PLP-dependent enzyme
MSKLLSDAAARAARYLATVDERSVAPGTEALAGLDALGGPMPMEPCEPASVLAALDAYGSPATVASTGGRYFGFVTGGTLPAALAATWLAAAWDQNAGLVVQSPTSAAIEEIVMGWLRELLRLPATCAVGFVSGDTMANLCGLAAARHALLRRAGWDVERQGLFGAPEISVVVGAEVHVSVLKALSILGLGQARVHTVPADGQGRMRADALPPLGPLSLVCIQAGNVNTGAFDPAAAICRRAREAGAWVHVDGAFGLWAAAAPLRAHLMDGYMEADSWAMDCHKWLNVPYDSGVVFVRHADDLRAAMTVTGPYLIVGDRREPCHYVPEMSRRARGIEIWAALKSLGARGVAQMLERHCGLAQRFAAGLRAAGYAVLNDVVLNQVLVSFGDSDATRRVIAELQRDGTCWCGGTTWQGHSAMRISVSGWATTEDDVDRSLAAIVRIAGA